jgi:HD superfamily phosphodiesterase
MKNYDSSHDMNHIDRVIHYTKEIIKPMLLYNNNICIETVLTCALTHDIMDHKYNTVEEMIELKQKLIKVLENDSISYIDNI